MLISSSSCKLGTFYIQQTLLSVAKTFRWMWFFGLKWKVESRTRMLRKTFLLPWGYAVCNGREKSREFYSFCTISFLAVYLLVYSPKFCGCITIFTKKLVGWLVFRNMLELSPLLLGIICKPISLMIFIPIKKGKKKKSYGRFLEAAYSKPFPFYFLFFFLCRTFYLFPIC